MTMSKDRVEFYLPPRYFQTAAGHNGFARMTMQKILRGAFDMDFTESADLMKAYPHGFGIQCRPSQFARFIVYRHDADEGINGVRDLKPSLIPGKCVVEADDVCQRIAQELGYSVSLVRRIACKLGNADYGEDTNYVAHVADRPHQECYESRR